MRILVLWLIVFCSLPVYGAQRLKVKILDRQDHVQGKRQSNGIYAQASFGAEVEAWWHREGSIADIGAGRKRIS
jgi:hypothetical protein